MMLMASQLSLWLVLAVFCWFPVFIGGELVNDGDQMIIINSDGGSDDALAILQVLQDPDANLLAITCTYGNVDVNQACDNIRRTLQLEDMADQVNVYLGSSQPIIGDALYDDYYGADGFGNASSDYPLPDTAIRLEHAANAIVGLVNTYPGKITLISLGPLTNLALAVQIDPTIPSKLRALAIMGGSATADGNLTPVAEFNVADDPVAAKVVIDSYPPGCPTTIMTWDMCTQYAPSWSWYDNWVSVNNTESNFIQSIFSIANEKNRDSNQTFQCCDLQATTAVLYPDVVNQTDPEYVQVETCGSLTKGELVVDYRTPPSNPPNIAFISQLNMADMLALWDDITGVNPNDNNTITTTVSENLSTTAFNSSTTDSLGL